MSREAGMRIDDEHRCKALAKSTRKRCRRARVPGLEVCRMHGGATKRSQQKKNRELVRRRVGRLLAAAELVFEDPLEGLLAEVARSSAAVTVYGSLVGELEGWPGIKVFAKGSNEYEEMHEAEEADETEEHYTINRWTPGGIIGPNHLGDLGVHPFVKLWNEERERHAKMCKMALDAGVAERQVRLAERQGEIVAKLFETLLADPELKLSHKQRSVGRRVAARELRALPAVAG